MLVLTRKVGEKIWIGNDICLTVVHVERGKVRLGIDAPKDVNILRAELTGDSTAAVDEREPVATCC